jgi:hypothetical protein
MPCYMLLVWPSHFIWFSFNFRPQLQQVCVYSLLFTEAGKALLEIIGTGSDTIEMALAQQGR